MKSASAIASSFLDFLDPGFSEIPDNFTDLGNQRASRLPEAQTMARRRWVVRLTR